MKLNLPNVTLLIAACKDYEKSRLAFNRCANLCNFGDYKFLTHFDVKDDYIVKIPELKSIHDYNVFMIKKLNNYFHTKHVLIVQWDGFILNVNKWDNEYLNYDYIGAPWPVDIMHSILKEKNIPIEYNVGNGGFSLRTKKLHRFLKLDNNMILKDNTGTMYPEDVIICQLNRKYLEDNNIKFAPFELARKFSWERLPKTDSFGVHQNMHIKEVADLLYEKI